MSVIAVLALAVPSDAHAECVKAWKTARDVQRNSTLVFSGTVIKTADAVEATFEVDRVWKGDVRRRTTLTLLPGIDSHGASYFKEGTAYLVFARVLPKLVRTDTAQDTPLFEISQCFPTRPLADARNSWINSDADGRRDPRATDRVAVGGAQLANPLALHG